MNVILDKEKIEAWRTIWRRTYSELTAVAEMQHCFQQLDAMCDLALKGLSPEASNHRLPTDKIIEIAQAYFTDEMAVTACVGAITVALAAQERGPQERQS